MLKTLKALLLASIFAAGILLSARGLINMPLLSIWKSNPEAVLAFTIEQLVNTAGDGKLKDNSVCCTELRTVFEEIGSEKLSEYIEYCLENVFNNSGLVLQDIVNELGRRLDFTVTNGRYRGTANTIGFDGIWYSPEGQSLVVEVKKTDAYQISLNKIAAYRERLLADNKLSNPSSILIVVGNQATDELEAQVRGSRHAWDVRLISVAALLRLVFLKEEADELETGTKIRGLLVPKEYTRLDGMIDVMFATAKDVDAESDQGLEKEIAETQNDKIKGVWQFTKFSELQERRDAILSVLGKRENAKLIKKTRALYWSPNQNIRAACTISKRYSGPMAPYWYAYHPRWDEFLKEGSKSFLVLGCMDKRAAFAIPRDVIWENVNNLNTSNTHDGQVYWHIHLVEDEQGNISMMLPKKRLELPLKKFLLPI